MRLMYCWTEEWTTEGSRQASCQPHAAAVWEDGWEWKSFSTSEQRQQYNTTHSLQQTRQDVATLTASMERALDSVWSNTDDTE